MGVLDGFMSAWSNARHTFGQGVPPPGEEYDGSARLRQMQATVESARPGSAWSGSAATAYDAVNTDHGKVFDKLATLDQRLGAKVAQSAQVVGAGRQNLDAVRQWVLDAAASVPPGKNREQLLMPIVARGLGQVTDIVTKANGELSTIGGEVRTIAARYHTLGNQKFAQQQGDDGGPQGAWDPDEKKDEEDTRKGIEDGTDQGHDDGESLVDGKLTPEASARLHDATTLTPQEKAALDGGNLAIPPERMAYLNGLSHSLDDESPAEIKAILAQLPPEDAKAVANALHLVGSEGVKTSPVDPSLRPGDEGYVPPAGGKENLPKNIQEIFDAELKTPPVPTQITLPDGRTGIEYPDPEHPYRYLDEYRDIAAISQHGDPALQRGSALNEGMLAESRELLEDYHGDLPPGASQSDYWVKNSFDPAVQDMLAAAGHDPVAVHDAFTGVDGTSPNNDFIGDVLKHEWTDDGRAAGSLFPDPVDTSVRSGQTMHAFDDYAGKHYQDLLNISGKESLGQINPALTQALAHANIPYIDDMVQANRDGTHGFGSLDPDNKDMPVTRGLFAVIDSDPTANKDFGVAATDAWKGYISDYSKSVVAEGGVPAAGALQAAGYLQRMMDQGEFLNQYDQTGDQEAAATKAMESRARWYDLAHDVGSFIPELDSAISLYDKMPGDPLREMFVGPAPNETEPALSRRDPNDVMHLVASYAVAQGAGDLNVLGDQVKYGTWWGDPWLEPLDGDVSVSNVSAYLSGLAHGNDMGWNMYDSAYGDGLEIPDDELENLWKKGS